MAIYLIICLGFFGCAFMLSLWLFTIPGMRKEIHQRKILSKARRTKVSSSADILVSKARVSEISLVNEALLKIPVIKHFTHLVQKADIGVNAFVVFLICAILYVGSYNLMRSSSAVVVLAHLIAVIVALIPVFVIQIKIRHRQKAFEKHFVEGLGIIRNALKSGQGLTSALRIVSEDASWPVDVEFKKLLAEVEYGFPFQDALDRLEKRVELDELSFFVSTIKIQQRAGGNLSEVIENIEETIRTRFELKREVNTLSAQGKMSGLVLVLVPVFLVIVLSIMNPGFFRPLFEEDIIRVALYALIGWGFCGVYFIYRIVNIKI